MVYYYIPEDHESEDVPNAFGINKSLSTLTVRDIISSFPVQGTYHFRFKQSYNNGAIWMDIPDEASSVPLFSNRIIMKVTRISWETSQGHKSPQSSQSPTQAPPSNTINIFDSHSAHSAADFDHLFHH